MATQQRLVDMPTKRKPHELNRVLPYYLILGAIGISTTLYAIYHLSQAATRPEKADPYYSLMFTLTLIGIALLTVLVFGKTIKLLNNLHKHRSGAKLSASLAIRLLITSMIPVSIIGGFTWLFLSYDLDKTFNSQVNTALSDSLQLTRTSITMRARQALEQTRGLANIMINMDYTDLISDIEVLRRNAGAIELAVFDHQGNLVAFAHQNLDVMTVDSPSTAALLRATQEQEYFEYSSDPENDYTIKVLSEISKPSREPYYLQAVYIMPDAFNTLADSVRESYQQHQSYNYLQPHITTSLLLVLSLIIALTLLTAFWLSALFGETMTRPVRQLIDATRKVTYGDFSTPITDMPNNDLGTLGNNFNAMLLALRDAENMNNQIQDQLSDQNNFLGTVLDNITAGVITLDWRGYLQTSNRAAAQILETELTAHYGRRPPTTDNNLHDSYEELMSALSRAQPQQKNNRHWRIETTLSKYSQRKTLICHGARLPGQNSKNRGGEVIVFEDVTEFQQSQRNAAWEEVARRLAHEIKNPLTPIRLQTERLQRKLGDKLTEAQDRHILDRATHTIINQVDAMQQMVSDFSQYAKPLELRRQTLDINALLQEIIELYPDTEIELNLSQSSTMLNADPVQLRQVIHNLIKNAIEAHPEPKELHILWESEVQDEQLCLTIEDNGTGFTDLSKDPFEPYVTGKTKGTGLGLAIVKKIITEHQGSIQAGPSKTLGGAKISMTFPLSTNPH